MGIVYGNSSVNGSEMAVFRYKWRSGRDSNPRYGFAVYSLSRRAPSTTRPPLRISLEGGPLEGARASGKLAAHGRKPLCAHAMRSFGPPPSADEIEAIARARARSAARAHFATASATSCCWSRNSPTTRRSTRSGIDDPFELTGIYEGVPLTERSVEQSGHAAGTHPPVPPADPRRMGRRRATRSSISSRTS